LRSQDIIYVLPFAGSCPPAETGFASNLSGTPPFS
jgi:hypothetical protein